MSGFDPKISAVVVARDEEKNIQDCLAGLSFCDEIILVDSGSQDRTVALAAAAGVKVYPHAFRDFASQKNFGISKAQNEWVLLIDADERVSPLLAAEIKKALKRADAEAYYFRRENRIFGRRMRHGANRDDRQLRLAKKEKAVFQGRVHERIFTDGKTRCFRNPLLHHSTETVKDYMKKLNFYTSLETDVFADKGECFSTAKMERRPIMLFLYSHWLKAGFLDGIEGFLFNVLSAYYEFVRRAKTWELETKEKVV